MMHTRQIYRDLNLDYTTTHPLHRSPIWDTDSLLEAVGRSGRGRWSAQLSSDYTDNQLLLIEPIIDAPGEPTYVISFDLEHIELAELRDDQLHTIGAFRTIAETANQITGLLRTATWTNFD